ncbi:alpha/beta fold hydrolase [uncultured Desulfobacter sp.]|uniref:alpha/beta hydrolase n=1 Tax=uncultured Desulfobacter sp. TaxID=240139 RepID=UPI002AAB3948|nr:alpha/beta fold hydrolase [uncultured Desulfobacter sp.]
MDIKHKWALGGIVFFISAVVFLSGPRVEIDTRIHPVSLPQDLDRFLVGSESRFDDIVPGTEKIIFWARGKGIRTPFSVIYLHGFSASRKETAPLADIVAQKLCANVFYTRFTGHGRTSQAMLDGSVNAWLNDGAQALTIGQRIGEKIVVIGTSTGGTIAAWLATQPAAGNVAAFILISPNFGPANRMAKILLLPWGGNIAELLIGRERAFKPDNPGHEKYWTCRYPTRALLPMMGVVRLAASADLSRIKAPVLVIYSPSDRVVDSALTETAFKKIGAARKLLVPYTGSSDPDQHVLAGDILSPASTQVLGTIISDFILGL